ncbi:MAG TPA: TSUP family transporter, partial [Gemmatimonadales bacterium]|nr:TSUP family transporter [Gemmatimonadales bacterium]
LPVGFLGAMQYYKKGEVNVPYAVLIALGLFLGAYLGARWAGGVSDTMLRRAFGALLLLMSVKLLFF